MFSLSGPGLVGRDVSSISVSCFCYHSLLCTRTVSHQFKHWRGVLPLCPCEMNIDSSLFPCTVCVCACGCLCARARTCVIKREKERRMYDAVSCSRHLCNNQRGPPSFLFVFLLAAESSAWRHRQEVPHRDMIDKWTGRFKNTSRECADTLPNLFQALKIHTHRDT